VRVCIIALYNTVQVFACRFSCCMCSTAVYAFVGVLTSYRRFSLDLMEGKSNNQRQAVEICSGSHSINSPQPIEIVHTLAPINKVNSLIKSLPLGSKTLVGRQE
jgi:hypothetical protein